MSKVQMARDAMLTGREFSIPTLAEELGIDQFSTDHARRTLRKMGHDVQMVRQEGTRKVYRVVLDTPAPTPTPPTPPTSIRKQTGVSSRIRSRLIAGDSLYAKQIAEEEGCTGGTLQYVVQSMRKRGYRFKESSAPDGSLCVLYTMSHNPDTPRPFTDGLEREAARTPAPVPATTRETAPATPTSPRLSLNGHYTPLTASWLPDLGEAVQVTLLALDGSGTVRIGLQGADGGCLVVLEGSEAG